MRGSLDFTSWSSGLTTLVGLVLVSLIAVGIRLVFMQTIQRRRERENRQINERLRTLIAAYKTLGGSFTGNLVVDPTHLRDMRRAQAAAASEDAAGAAAGSESDRRRRMRDAVEAALSDIVLLGTEDQVRLAAQAAADMVAGWPVEVKALVVSLRDFIRQALDLDAVPADVHIPAQGPLRPGGAGGARAGGGARGAGGAGGAAAGGGGGAGRGGGGGGGAGGMGAGMGLGGMGGAAAVHHAHTMGADSAALDPDDPREDPRP